jgi:hypothetical protein
MYKQLIEDASAEKFNNWAEAIIYKNITHQEAGIHPGYEPHDTLMRQMIASDAFKHYLHSGFMVYMIQVMEVSTTYEVELLIASRVTSGFAIGFKYAMYLHEQRELQSIK